MFGFIRRFLFGAPLATSRELHTRLPRFLALPVFSSDAVSSVAYGPGEVLIALAVVGSIVWQISLPIGIAIVILIGIVSMSYRQTIHAYPHGGGSYIVAKENLGTWYGLVAAASILTDYVLTVAVSVAAGIAAVVSAFPSLGEHQVALCVLAVALVALANLRGVKESGALFAPPTYAFIFSLFALVFVGIYKVFFGGPVQHIIPSGFDMPVITPLGMFVVLKAFSSGCSALTGIEAIADGVPAFKPPESRNAASTMTIMAVILGTMVLGVTFLGHIHHALPGDFLKEHESRIKSELVTYYTAKGEATKVAVKAAQREIDNLKSQTLVSQLAQRVFGKSWFYYFIQFATMAILILAANTAYQDFPRLSSILARDRFAPRQLATRGDKLVFSNGIALLSLFAIILLIAFKGETTLLIPLYAVGVFISFTLSQWGMAVRQKKLKHGPWKLQTFISRFGAVVTGVVAVVLLVTKFFSGAWIAFLAISVLVYMFHKIHQHYIELGNQLRIDKARPLRPIKTTTIVLVAGIHEGIIPALEYAMTLSHDCRALYIEVDPSETPLVRDRWELFGFQMPLVVLESPYRSLIGPVLKYLDEAKKEREDYLVTVILPEFVPKKAWHKILHNQSGIFLKIALMFKRDIVTTNVRYYLEK